MYRRKGIYSKKLINEMFENAKEQIGKLYDAKISLPDKPNKTSKLLNIVSNFKDCNCNRNIEDFLAEKILDLKIGDCLKTCFENSKKIRKAGYDAKHKPENIEFTSGSKRRENNIVRLLYKYREDLNNKKDSPTKNLFGKIIDYEVPLTEGTKSNIDMLAITNDSINIIEWKTDSKTCSDSLLRAVMEITTYEYELDKQKLLEDFGLDKEYDLNSFKKIIVIFEGTKPAIAYKAIKEGISEVSNLAKLLDDLKIKVICLSKDSFPRGITDETTINYREIKLAYDF